MACAAVSCCSPSRLGKSRRRTRTMKVVFLSFGAFTRSALFGIGIGCLRSSLRLLLRLLQLHVGVASSLLAIDQCGLYSRSHSSYDRIPLIQQRSKCSLRLRSKCSLRLFFVDLWALCLSLGLVDGRTSSNLLLSGIGLSRKL